MIERVRVILTRAIIRYKILNMLDITDTVKGMKEIAKHPRMTVSSKR